MADQIVFTTHLHDPDERPHDGISWWMFAFLVTCVVFAFLAGF